MNFGPKINVGGDLDYIYSRGYYKNNGNKLLSYRLFGSYKSDRYEAHAYLSNFNFINYENGGLANDSVITNPDQYFAGERNQDDPKAFNTRYPVKAWNRYVANSISSATIITSDSSANWKGKWTRWEIP